MAAVRRNLRSQLNRIDMVNEDGSVENLGENMTENSQTDCGKAQSAKEKDAIRRRTLAWRRSLDAGGYRKAVCRTLQVG